MPSSAQHAAHALPMLLNATDGSIQLGNLPALIGPTLLLDEARAAFAPLVRGERDVGTGYRWLSLHRLSSGGVPAGISLCFHGQQLDMVTIGVDLPGATLEDGWPTQAAIDAEVAFMRRTLGAALGRNWPAATPASTGARHGPVSIRRASWPAAVSATGHVGDRPQVRVIDTPPSTRIAVPVTKLLSSLAGTAPHWRSPPARPSA